MQILLLITIVCVPTMLFVKPIIEIRRLKHAPKVQLHKAKTDFIEYVRPSGKGGKRPERKHDLNENTT